MTGVMYELGDGKGVLHSMTVQGHKGKGGSGGTELKVRTGTLYLHGCEPNAPVHITSRGRGAFGTFFCVGTCLGTCSFDARA
jgi:hypothetical protein